ncbi:MAG: DUF5069 domain-containing protein [Opitutales bacterium]|nr:DUF5069 domain-containing protein [Opitutales bacterium]MCH8541586.1 DUF5069 domain-containing protein [Opitutales bacterium]
MTNPSPRFRPKNPLPSPYLPDGRYGLMHLPRLMEKLVRLREGRLEPYYQPTVGQGFDRMLGEHLGVPMKVFQEVAGSWARAPEEALERLREWLPDDPKPERWNRRLVQRGLWGYGRFRLERRKEALGLSHRTEIRTMIDLIEFVEGRGEG